MSEHFHYDADVRIEKVAIFMSAIKSGVWKEMLKLDLNTHTRFMTLCY